MKLVNLLDITALVTPVLITSNQRGFLGLNNPLGLIWEGHAGDAFSEATEYKEVIPELELYANKNIQGVAWLEEGLLIMLEDS